jgi:hypothetical protein
MKNKPGISNVQGIIPARVGKKVSYCKLCRITFKSSWRRCIYHQGLAQVVGAQCVSVVNLVVTSSILNHKKIL